MSLGDCFISFNLMSVLYQPYQLNLLIDGFFNYRLLWVVSFL